MLDLVFCVFSIFHGLLQPLAIRAYSFHVFLNMAHTVSTQNPNTFVRFKNVGVVFTKIFYILQLYPVGIFTKRDTKNNHLNNCVILFIKSADQLQIL